MEAQGDDVKIQSDSYDPEGHKDEHQEEALPGMEQHKPRLGLSHHQGNGGEPQQQVRKHALQPVEKEKIMKRGKNEEESLNRGDFFDY